MQEISTTLSILMSLSLYIFSGWIYLEILKFVKSTLLNRMMSGKVEVGELLRMGLGVAVLGFVVMFGPYYTAQAISSGWEKFIPVMLETADGIVDDLHSIINDGPPVKIRTGETTIITPEPGINPLTGQAYDDPYAGGGGPGLPTPIMPEMRPTEVIPTPTPFAIENWQPGSPAPTPGG